MMNLTSLKGLLSDEDLSSIEGDAQLQTALALMAASGPSTTPTNFGQILLSGMNQGRQARQAGLQSALQTQELRQKRATELQRRQTLGNLFGNGTPDMQRLKQGFASALSIGDTETAKLIGEQIKALEPKFEKIGEGDQLINPVTKEVIAQGAPKKPSGVQEYEYAVAQGYKGSFNDFQTQLRRAGASNISYSGGDNAFTKKGAELMATTFNDVAVQGRSAQRSLQQINQLDSLLEKTGGGIVPQAKAVAGNFGIPVDGLNDVQAANAIINQLVPSQRPAGSGTMSDKDVELFKQSVPRLINQPGGNKKIIQTMRNIAEYDRKMGQIASDALTGRISREEADMLMQRIPNPLEGFSASGAQKPASNADALLKKYGVK